MMNHSGQNNNHEDGGFYKGLFFGLLLGVGLIWFLGTKEGKKLKEQVSERGEEFVEKAKESIDEALSEDFVENEQGTRVEHHGEESPPQRLFEKG